MWMSSMRRSLAEPSTTRAGWVGRALWQLTLRLGGGVPFLPQRRDLGLLALEQVGKMLPPLGARRLLLRPGPGQRPSRGADLLGSAQPVARSGLMLAMSVASLRPVPCRLSWRQARIESCAVVGPAYTGAARRDASWLSAGGVPPPAFVPRSNSVPRRPVGSGPGRASAGDARAPPRNRGPWGEASDRSRDPGERTWRPREGCSRPC